MKKMLKATINYIIVALLIILASIISIYMFLGQTIEESIQLINQVAIKIENTSEQGEIKLNAERNRLENYPEYGTEYGTIEIPKIDVNLPVYYGDTLEILKKGVGHSSGSYFPGEGGSIIYMGHNSKKMFRRFSELQIGNEIKVTTNYGEFTYKIYDMQLINENDTEKLPVQDEKEILMVYTCYPFNNIGYTTQRYVVYAELVQ